MSVQYKVLDDCFIGDVYRTPDKHNTFTVDEAYDPCPAHLELVGPPRPTGPNASEAAIKHANENGIDIEEVDGTGREGMITKSDVIAAIKAGNDAI